MQLKKEIKIKTEIKRGVEAFALLLTTTVEQSKRIAVTKVTF